MHSEPAPASWRCTNDEAFLDMCWSVFGVAPQLTLRTTPSGTVYTDEDGTVVLREVA